MDSVEKTNMEQNGFEHDSSETAQMEKMKNTTQMKISDNSAPQNALCLNGDVSKQNSEGDTILKKEAKEVVSDTTEVQPSNSCEDKVSSSSSSSLSSADNEDENADEKQTVPAEDRLSTDGGQTMEREQGVTDNVGQQTTADGETVINSGEEQVETTKQDDSIKQPGKKECTSDQKMIESKDGDAASKMVYNSEKEKEQVTTDETNSQPNKFQEDEVNESKNKNDSSATGETNVNPENHPEATVEKTKEDPSVQENISGMTPHNDENMDASDISSKNEVQETAIGDKMNNGEKDEKIDEVGEKTIAPCEQKNDESIERKEHYQEGVDTDKDTQPNERNEEHSKLCQDIDSKDNDYPKEETNGKSSINDVPQETGDNETDLKVTEKSQEDRLHTPEIPKSEDPGDMSVSVEKSTIEGREQMSSDNIVIHSDNGEKVSENIDKEDVVSRYSIGEETKITEEKVYEKNIETEKTENREIQPSPEVEDVDTPKESTETKEERAEHVVNMKNEDTHIFKQNEAEEIRMETKIEVSTENEEPDTFDTPKQSDDNEATAFEKSSADHKENIKQNSEEEEAEQNNAQVSPKNQNDDQTQSKAPDNNLKVVETVHGDNTSHDAKAEDNKKKKVRMVEPVTPAERARDTEAYSASPKPLSEKLQARIENAEKGGSQKFMEESEERKTEVTESDKDSEGAEGGKKDIEQSPSEAVQEPEEKKPHFEPEAQPQPDQEIESEPEEELLKILLEKNVEIDGHVDSISELESGVTKLLESMKQVTDHYKQRLDLQHLKDFTVDLGKFHGDFTSINEAYEKCDALFTNIGLALKELRALTETVRTKIDWKFETEDLSTWVDITSEQQSEKMRLKEEAVAAQKVAMKRAADVRAAVAKTVPGIAQAQELVARTEADAAEAEVEAKKARAEAKAALTAAEEARIAAEEKRKAEEIVLKKAEEKARQKAGEDRKRKEDEEKRIKEAASAKGISLADERKRVAEEKASTEKERKNPKNWPRYIYSIEGGGDFENGIGCVIRVIEGSMKRDYVECTRIDQLTGVLELVENEELISNIIEVKQSNPDKKIKFEEPMSIAIPCCLNRVPFGREAVIKTFSLRTWKELPANDVFFEDIKETKLFEARTKTFGLFAVVLRNKRDTLIFNRNGNKVSASSDSRISFTCKPGTFKVNTSFQLEYLSVDMAAINDLKHRRPKECEYVLSSSPIVRFSITNNAIKKPIQVTLPLPPAAARPKRPSTTGTPRGGDPKDKEKLPVSERPLTSFAPTKEDEPEECFYLLQHDATNGWTKAKTQDVTYIKTKDIVVFEMDEPFFERFLVLRLKQGARETTTEKIAGFLETSLLQRNVQVFLRQRHDDPNTVVVSCATSSRVEAALQAFAKDGFVEGPPPSKDLILKEGQIMEIGFRGNIYCSSDNKKLKFVFNTHMISKCAFEVHEKDKFAQKSFDSYRGFSKITTRSLVPRPSQTQPKPGDKVEMVEVEILLAELLISIPKPEPEPPKPLPTAPVKLTAIGPVTGNVLLHIAEELGDEWKKLAQSLSLRPVRIQAILRQNVHNENVQTRYDMLMAWAKRQPRSMDKSALLCQALAGAGRNDLAEEIRDKSEDFRQQQIRISRSTHLRQAFIKVSKTLAVVNEWKEFALSLGLTADDIRVVNEKGASGQEKCYITLEMWKDKQGENASITELASVLKRSRFDVLSREIEALIS